MDKEGNFNISKHKHLNTSLFTETCECKQIHTFTFTTSFK